MTRIAGWLLLALAAALPLAAAEPDDEAREKARTLYLRFANVPQGDNADALRESLQRLQATRIERPASGPASRPAEPAATSKPSTRPAPASQPAPETGEMDPAVLKALVELRGAEASVLVAMADGLYAQGRLKSAEAIYQAAGARGGDPETGAWILYQRANCLRKSDPATALKLYEQLAAQSPECPWADAAQAARKVLEWTTADKLHAVVEAAAKVEVEEKAAAKDAPKDKQAPGDKGTDTKTPAAGEPVVTRTGRT